MTKMDAGTRRRPGCVVSFFFLLQEGVKEDKVVVYVVSAGQKDECSLHSAWETKLRGRGRSKSKDAGQ